MIDYSWVRALIEKIGFSEEEKNYFQIAGFPRWETVNSNFLAFYFDRNGQHGFGSLFVDALGALIADQWNPKKKSDFLIQDCAALLAEGFNINREKHHIDLLLRSYSNRDGKDSWAIIIENKLHAELYNDLNKYWKAVGADRKFGVVLSLFPVEKKLLPQSENIHYINILHTDLCQKVKEGLGNHFQKSDSRHLVLLTEYLNNIENQFQQRMKQEEFTEKLNAFQKEGENILALFKVKEQLHTALGNTMMKVMQEFGWKCVTSGTNVYAKHFYTDGENYSPKEKKPDWSRIYIVYEDLLYQNQLTIYFELFSEKDNKIGTIRGKEILAKMKARELLKDSLLEYGNGGKEKGTYFHLAEKRGLELPVTDSFEDRIRAVLKKTLFLENCNVPEKVQEIFREIHAT